MFLSLRGVPLCIALLENYIRIEQRNIFGKQSPHRNTQEYWIPVFSTKMLGKMQKSLIHKCTKSAVCTQSILTLIWLKLANKRHRGLWDELIVGNCSVPAQQEKKVNDGQSLVFSRLINLKLFSKTMACREETPWFRALCLRMISARWQWQVWQFCVLIQTWGKCWKRYEQGYWFIWIKYC